MKLYLVKFTFLIALVFLFIQEISAQFSIDAQLRSRFEIRDGYQKLATEGSNPAFLVSQRTRLSFLYETKFLKLRISPQDVRLWGDQAVMNTGAGDNASLDLLEAFAEVRISNAVKVSAGRQQLVYDNRRLLGDRNWNQNGIAYDALVFKFLINGWNLHAGASWNNMKDVLTDNLYPATRIKSLNYLWLNRKFNDNLSISLLHISSGITKTDTTNPINFRHTSGLYGEYKNNNFNAWGNFFYQYGKNQKGNKVSAYLIDADASYKFGKFTPGAGLGYLSGNNKTIGQNGTDHLFDNLYGNSHKFFGFMDYYRTFASNTKQGGLADYYLWLDYKFSTKLNIRNITHYFALAKTNQATPTDKELGYENDLILKFKFSDWGDLESGYCFYLPTESLKTIQDVSDDKFSQFFYVQLNIALNLFNQTPSPEK